MHRRWIDLPRNLVRRLTASRDIPGRSAWDDEYRAGKWSYLRADDELPRYAMLASLVSRHIGNGSILDLGCGEGVLCEHLTPGSYKRCLGVDLSSEAISSATARGFPAAEFVCADVEQYRCDSRFDVIVFNEVLYYFREPVDVVMRFVESLSPQGVVLASMYLPSMKTIQRQVAELERRTTRHATYTMSHGESQKAWAVKMWYFGK